MGADLRAACEELVRAVRRAGRPVASEPEIERALASVHGGLEPPAEGWTEGDWWQRRADLQGWLRHYLALQLARRRPSEQQDLIRLRALAREPARVELSFGHVVACYPLTLWQVDHLTERAVILQRATEWAERIERLPGQEKHWLLRQLQRERLWQRCAILEAITQPPGALRVLPVTPTAAGRLLAAILDWLDGGNHARREYWRLRALVLWLWRITDRLTGASRWLGVPPWWTWRATALDFLAVMRQHLVANDERVRALPPLPSGRPPDEWGWTGFVTAYAAEQHAPSAEVVRYRSVVELLIESAASAARAEAERRLLDQQRKQERARANA
jgi:hypothetical protein